MGSVAYSNFAHPEPFKPSDREDGTDRAHTSADSRIMKEAALPSRLVRAVQAARRRRAALFEADLFSDPAWDILLELYALHLEQQRASVSSLYAASCVPATTALRWIAKLENDGLVVRTGDSVDARRSWIKLSAEGAERMGRFFEMLPLATISV